MKKIILGSYVLAALLAGLEIQAVGRNGAGINPNTGQSGMLGTTTDSRPPVGNKLGTTPDSRPPTRGIKNSVQEQYQTYQDRQRTMNPSGSASKPLGSSRTTWTSSALQLEVLNLSRKFSQAAVFMKDIAQGLADLRIDNPDIFEKYFGNRFDNRPALEGSDSSSWGPAFWNLPDLQKKVYSLKSELFKATKTMEDIGLGLAYLRKDNPKVFEKYFGDHEGLSSNSTVLDSDLEPSLELTK